MAAGTFRFKRFAVTQTADAGMKVGTDGVLLGAWCRLDDSQRRLLDVGTGTGVIALMLAQRAPESCIDALDIEPDCCIRAQANVAASPWADRIAIMHNSLQQYAAQTPHRYDHIVTNPPYFTESLLPPSAARTSARHTATLLHTELIDAVDVLLTPGGLFSVILPVEAAVAMERYAATRGLHIQRRTEVLPRREGAPKRILAEYARTAPPSPQTTQLPIMESAGEDFTEEYRALTHDFYLKF